MNVREFCVILLHLDQLCSNNFGRFGQFWSIWVILLHLVRLGSSNFGAFCLTGFSLFPLIRSISFDWVQAILVNFGAFGLTGFSLFWRIRLTLDLTDISYLVYKTLVWFRIIQLGENFPSNLKQVLSKIHMHLV